MFGTDDNFKFLVDGITQFVVGNHAADGALEQKLGDFMARHFSESSARDARLRLKPIEDVYLSGPVDPAFVTGNRAYLSGLLGIAGLILVLSIFNFTNLTAVQALRRGREVGVRKVLGADRRQLRRQLIGETVVSALAGVAIAVVVLGIAASVAPDWLGVPRALALLNQPEWIAVLILAGPALGLIGGLYPSLMLSRLDIVDAIQQKLTGRGRIAAVRNTLVVIQFGIAAGLIVASIVIGQQLRFIATADLGFDQEHVVTIQTEGEQLSTLWPTLRDQLTENPHVVSVTSSGHLMDGHQGSMPMVPDGIEPDEALSPLFKDVFLYHWKEESQHAILDELEWVRCDAGMTAEERDRAVDEFIELVGGDRGRRLHQ